MSSEELKMNNDKVVQLKCSLTEEERKLVLKAWENQKERMKRGYIELPREGKVFADMTTEEIGCSKEVPKTNFVQALAHGNGKRGDDRDILITIKKHSSSSEAPTNAGNFQRTIWFSEWAREYESWFKDASFRDALQRLIPNYLPEGLPTDRVTSESVVMIAKQFESLEWSLFEEETFAEFLAETCALMSGLAQGKGFKVDSLAVITMMAVCYQRRHSRLKDYSFSLYGRREESQHLFCFDVLELALGDGYLGQIPGTHLIGIGPKGSDLAERLPHANTVSPMPAPQGVQESQENNQTTPTTSTKVEETPDVVVPLPPWFVPDLPEPMQRLFQALEQVPAGMSAKELKDELGGMQPSRAKPKGKRYANWIAHFEKWIDHRRNCYRLRTIDEVKSRGPL